MPQMAPLSWTMLMLAFSTLLIMSLINIFYQMIKPLQIEKSKQSKMPQNNELNWKW